MGCQDLHVLNMHVSNLIAFLGYTRDYVLFFCVFFVFLLLLFFFCCFEGWSWILIASVPDLCIICTAWFNFLSTLKLIK